MLAQIAFKVNGQNHFRQTKLYLIYYFVLYIYIYSALTFGQIESFVLGLAIQVLNKK